jgi:hypothetical protein
MIRWEYRAIEATEALGSDLTALGNEGWELATIFNGLAWLKRDRVAYVIKTQADAHAAERGEQ